MRGDRLEVPPAESPSLALIHGEGLGRGPHAQPLGRQTMPTRLTLIKSDRKAS